MKRQQALESVAACGREESQLGFRYREPGCLLGRKLQVIPPPGPRVTVLE